MNHMNGKADVPGYRGDLGQQLNRTDSRDYYLAEIRRATQNEVMWRERAVRAEAENAVLLEQLLAARSHHGEIAMKADDPGVGGGSLDFRWRTLATMLGWLAREMRAKKYGRINVPQANRDGSLGGFDRFSLEDVERAQLEAERLARISD